MPHPSTFLSSAIRWLLLGCAALLPAPKVSAQGPWFSAPTHCGTEAEFTRRVADMLGPEAGPVMPQRLEIRVEATGSYRLELRMDAVERVLRDADCHALLRSAAVVVAAAVDPAVAPAPASPPAPGQEAVTPPPASVGPAVQAPPPTDSTGNAGDGEPEPPPASPRVVPESAPAGDGPTAGPVVDEVAPRPDRQAGSKRLGILLGLTGALRSGDQPPPALDVGVLGTLRLDALYVALQLGYGFLQVTDLPSADGVDVGVEVRAFRGQVELGYSPWPFLGVYVGPHVVWLRGSGVGGGLAPQTGAGLLLALAAGVTPGLSFGDLRAELDFSLRFALARPSFEVAGFGEVFRPSLWAGAVAMRLAYQVL